MIIKSILIKNFKSINEISLNIAKYDNSYTRMLVGVNESGKSNVLEAISLLNAENKNKYNYEDIHNRKNNLNEDVKILFELDFDNNLFVSKINSLISSDLCFDFEIKNILKMVYLEEGKNIFLRSYYYDIEIKEEYYFRAIPDRGGSMFSFEIVFGEKEDFGKLTNEVFKKYFNDDIIKLFETHEPEVSFWETSKRYLISSWDLNEFKNNLDSNIPIKNIFRLSGYMENEDIIKQIDSIDIDRKRSELISALNEKINKHIKKVWKHNIDIVIEITETGRFSLLIKDLGKNNQHDRFKIDDRSEGAQHFLSLILSLSIETLKGIRKNQLILIDEPENHLHPSGIRDMRDELLRIGKENYLFVSTHSPFLIDRTNKKRNIIVKKDNKAQTIIKEIKEDDDIRGDEVLREAFGINVYQDLLNPQRILLEGASDKKILDKVFQIKNKEISTTNGNGTNIDTTASMFNQNNISIIVIVDDDEAGKKYKENILKIGGVYSKNNVFTLKDLVLGMTDGGTIEDLLGKEYIESKFKKFCKDKYNEEPEINLEGGPFVEQLKAYLHKAGKKVSDNLLDDFKARVSNDLSLSKTTLGRKFPLLDELYQSIEEKLKMKDAD